jgi:hypothetical protein
MGVHRSRRARVAADRGHSGQGARRLLGPQRDGGDAARPADIRDWQCHGLQDWTFQEVRAAYRDMENTHDGDDGYRGRTGRSRYGSCGTAT